MKWLQPFWRGEPLETEYKLRRSCHGSWHISVKRWGIWWPLDVRTGIDRAVERLRELSDDKHL